ncbi:MAG: hypothetical protein Fues2KO_08950 [Fuerstiella sp.]
MAVLKKLYGESPLPVYTLAVETTIGRNQDCDIVVPSPSVSRQHAQIVQIEGEYFVEDLGSRNGSRINGRVIESRTPLKDGDQVEFSNLPYAFFLTYPSAELSGSSPPGGRVMEVQPLSHVTGDSVRRQPARRGERIHSSEPASHGFRNDQVTSRLQIADSSGAWPVSSNATTKLNHLLRLMHALRRHSGAHELLNRLQQMLLELFPNAERLAVVLHTPGEQDVVVVAAAGQNDQDEVEVCLPVVQTSIQNSEAILYADHWRERDSGEVELANSRLPTILAVPLLDRGGQPIGAVQLDTTDIVNPLTEDDLELLLIINQLVAYSIDQADMQELAAQEAAVRQHTADGRHLLSLLSTDSCPPTAGFQIDHQILVTRDVAADQIDFVPLPDGTMACMLMDVPGRGADAAGLMALLTRLMLAGLMETRSAAGTLTQVDAELRRRLPAVPMVISAAVLLVNPDGHAVTLAVAGHCPVVLVRACGTVEKSVDACVGPPLGLAECDYIGQQWKFEVGDTLTVFTDGAVRLADPSGRMLRYDHLVELVQQAVTVPDHTTDHLQNKLDEFRQSVMPLDDVAFVTVRRISESKKSALEAETRDS